MSNKVSQSFKDTIKAYLDQRAQSDPLFATSYQKAGKSIDECCNYIVQEVQKMHVNGLADDEVFGLAVVNHTVELTEEEKEQARKEAYDQFQKEEVAKLRSQKKEPEEKEKKKAPAKPKPEPAFESPSLFDFGDEGEE